MSFVHLHNHTEYSLLNGMIRIPDLVRRAKVYGMEAVAITDYGNIFGAVDFFQEAKKAHIKPIIGSVVWLPSHDQFNLRLQRKGIDSLFGLVLLIQNKQGYLNLCQLLTKACLEGFYYKPRIDTSLLKQFNEGLICLSGGWEGAINHHLFEGKRDEASQQAEKMAEIFGERYYLEIQENGVEGQHELNLEILEIAKKGGHPVVATNNCHYLNRDDAEAFEALMCIQTGATLHGETSRLKFSTDGYYFKSGEEMADDFAYCPSAQEETGRLANLIDFEFDLKTHYFPRFDPPAGLTLDDYLREEAMKGLEERWPDIVKNCNSSLKKTYQTRLEDELAIIKQTGFAGYFLIVSDFIRYAKNQGIPVGPGRGSAAGSLVAYCTRITDLDPIPYHLLFERFLNPERINMPDVDIDFCVNGRDQVLDYVAKKFGNVSQIITFGKMKARGVIRDVGRVLDIPLEQVDRIAKLVPTTLNITLEEAKKQEPRLKEVEENDPQIRRLMEIAGKLEGLNRHASTHAAGVVISDRPLTDFLPLYKGSIDDVVTQFDMKAVEKIGLIKFDFLGLKTLTVIHDALKIIRRTRKEDLNILSIPLNDPLVYQLLCKADSAGIFQLESEGMKDLMVRLKPSTFEDLIALVALYRPGPLGSGMVDDFINRKQGKTAIVYDLPQLKSILEDTYGVIVYQEQVMQIASLLAGYTLGEADILRRAMGKKKPEEMASQQVRFLQGCLERKIPRQKAERIFELMAKFAEYGFNKSHSAAYALVSYQTAYLKAHYRVEYMAALLTNEMHDTDKILEYIQDCRAHNLNILPPDINESDYGFSVIDDQTIRYGLGALKNVGEGAIESIVVIRTSRGKKFDSFLNFIESLDFKKINRRVLESLIKAGALDQFGSRRKAMMEILDKSMEWAGRRQRESESGQANLFSSLERKRGQKVGIAVPETGEWVENEKLKFEKESFGFYFSGHPLRSYEAEIRRVATTDSQLANKLSSQTEVTLVGMISTFRVITTKKGSRMAFVNLEDLKGSVEIIIFSDLFQKCADLLSRETPLVIKGAIDRTDEGAKIIAREVLVLTEFLSDKTRSIHFKIPALWLTEEKLKAFYAILKEFSGDCRGYLHMIEPGQTETILELSGGIRLSEPELLTGRVNSLFEGRVVEYRL